MVIIAHIAAVAEISDQAVRAVINHDRTTYRPRLKGLVRGYLDAAAYDADARRLAVRASIEAARTRDDLSDIVNVAVEELVRHRYELPAFGTLVRVAGRPGRWSIVATIVKPLAAFRSKRGSAFSACSLCRRDRPARRGTVSKMSRNVPALSACATFLPTSGGCKSSRSRVPSSVYQTRRFANLSLG